MMDPNATECPKCGLEFKTLLHPFCTHTECPPRELAKTSKGAKPLPEMISGEEAFYELAEQKRVIIERQTTDLAALIAVCESEFESAGTADEPDDEPVMAGLAGESTCALTFGHIRRARRCLTALRGAQ